MPTEINPTTGLKVDALGPIIEFLTASNDTTSNFCTLKGTIASGVFVPIHSHADTEEFIVISGELECLRKDEDGYQWLMAKVGDYIHIPSAAPHAYRNVSKETAVVLIITTKRMGAFFEQAGRPLSRMGTLPTPEELGHFIKTSIAYGYWLATPEENAEVGLSLPS